ncbi:MAG: glycosyltransferase family 9 protein [Ignavibacteria bacterium]|nr:glycosyltransferase family 9 protein [Ignavibacteria bacterium]
MINKSQVKKILIIKLRGIGDVVLSTIVLDNLKYEFPSAQIDYISDKPSKAFLENLSFITNVYTYPRKLSKKLKLFWDIRKNRYDLVFDFFSNPSTAQITFLSGAKYKIGFPYKGRKFAYNLFGPSERNKYHNAELHLEVLKKIGLECNHQNLHFELSENDNLFVFKFLTSINPINKLLVGISPSGGWESKKCDSIKFAEIGLALIKKYKAQILILWGPEDKIQAEEINHLIGNGSLLAPATSIMQMASFIKHCDLFIANDSGPMHISTAVGTPVLSLHGPTNPNHQGPFGYKHEWINLPNLDCIMCNLLVCPRNHECFKELPIDKVMNKVEKLIEKNNIDVQ